MKNQGLWLVGGLALGWLAHGWWASWDRERTVSRKLDTVRVETSAVARALARQHGAHVSWDSAFESVETFSRPPFTLDVIEALMPADSAPILYVGTVADIQPSRGGKFLFLAPPLGDVHNVHLQIFCPENLAQVALKARRDLWSEIAVVSRIHSVRRHRFIVSPEEVGGEEAGSEVALSLGTETPFLAEGDCRGLAPLPEGFEPGSRSLLQRGTSPDPAGAEHK